METIQFPREIFSALRGKSMSDLMIIYVVLEIDTANHHHVQVHSTWLAELDADVTVFNCNKKAVDGKIYTVAEAYVPHFDSDTNPLLLQRG